MNANKFIHQLRLDLFCFEVEGGEWWEGAGDQIKENCTYIAEIVIFKIYLCFIILEHFNNYLNDYLF